MREVTVAGVPRCSTRQFTMWVLPWFAMLAFGALSAGLCLWKGLNQTNMDNRFAFGLWIFLDLSIIALGAGAFLTGLLVYILKRHELKAVINTAVIVGFVCYSGAVTVLAIDVGQPLRAWFTFWHPNVHSMLTEVTFCITCYLTVLTFEYLPLILKKREFRKVPKFLMFEFELHKLMPVLAGVGAFLSFFHQGSLGGLFGVLRGRPFAFREGFAIWPSTFFLFILSAVAAGPAFLMLITWTIEEISGRRLVKRDVFESLAKISGTMLLVYVLAKCVDTLIWINNTSPGAGFPAHRYYSTPGFGPWLLFAEVVCFGLVPALILLDAKKRKDLRWVLPSALAVCTGIVLNRYVLTIQTLAVPTLPFDHFLSYTPSWQEVGTFLGVVAYGVLIYSYSFRYLPLFPQERELAAETAEVEARAMAHAA